MSNASRIRLRVDALPAILSLVVVAQCAWLNESVQAQDNALTQVVLDAYLANHDGWSTDELLLQDDLNQKFIAACRAKLPDAKVADLNWTMLNLRKAGKLSPAKRKSKPLEPSQLQSGQRPEQQASVVAKRRRDNHAAYHHLAEIAARSLQDRYKTSTDRIMCNPQQRQAFDDLAKSIAPSVDAYLMRKAAFGLRKARRLRPELVLRIADWDREITTHRAADLSKDASKIPNSPGIYILSDQTGYLYVGESINLRERLTKHLDESDRESLANYLRKNGVEKTTVEIHAFPKDSRAKQVTVRRAYESELIASRKPRFNVRP